MPKEKQSQGPSAATDGNQKNGIRDMSEEIRETAIIAPETREAEVKKIAKPESSAVGGLHTLKGDISTYIKEKDISLTEIAAEMTKRRRLEKENAEPKKIFLLAGGTLLIIAGLATAS